MEKWWNEFTDKWEDSFGSQDEGFPGWWNKEFKDWWHNDFVNDFLGKEWWENDFVDYATDDSYSRWINEKAIPYLNENTIGPR